MGLIYQPKGRAREYSDWALNIYDGCTHECSYCYSPLVLHRERSEFHSKATLRKGFFKRLQHQLSSGNIPVGAQVLLCFTCDPYQPIERDTFFTRRTITMLKEAGLDICVLTKAPTLAYRDVDLYGPNDAFATTLTFSSARFQESLQWEQRAELPHQRIMGLKAFHDAGVRTWVSLEPIVDERSLFDNITDTHQFVNHYKIGKLNYMKSDIDWKKLAIRIASLMDGLGQSYYMKDDLREYLDGH